MGDVHKMLKQAQKMQAEMARIQEELAAERLEASAGGGVVRAVANGHGALLELHIDPSVVDPADVALLADLVRAAVNEAQRNARALAERRMRQIAGGLQIPGLLGP
ncbi:MAG: YbaB/EbfC family nucleoid-associated protein [Armatimonadota bacterium]|nr:YbaB/EbfC family nucleoid-associated protein [Armatimonadota bacterium]MDR7548367.1 YbaB/EbfC family nucleoid-associated protein [Armatimonadota bacterium]